MAKVSTGFSLSSLNSTEFVDLFYQNEVEQLGIATETSLTFTFKDLFGLSTVFEINGENFEFSPFRGTVTGFQIGPDVLPVLEVRDISISLSRFLNDLDSGTVAEAYRSQLRGDDLFLGGDETDIIRSYSGDDTIRSGRGADDIKTAAGADLVIAGGGDDFVRGGGGADSIKGGGGLDRLNGQGGDDQLRGGGGGDEIKGGGGADFIVGGGGADTINGGRGDDTLIGSRGDDMFQFTGAFGDDIVRDFTNGSDLLDLSAVADSFDALQISRRSGDVEIQIDDMTITLLDTRRGDLDGSDFVF